MSVSIFSAMPLGALLRRHKNLAGLMVHGRRVGTPGFAQLLRTPTRASPYTLRLYYPDGSTALAPFGDWRVCAEWLAKRHSWGRLRVSGLPEFVGRYDAIMDSRAGEKP